MSARQIHSVNASAFLLAAVLEQYELEVDMLGSRAPADEAALHARMTSAMAEMRLLCAGLPVLSVAWMHLLISHAELVHCLSRGAGQGGSRRTPHACKADHLAAIRALHQQCLGLFTRVEQGH